MAVYLKRYFWAVILGFIATASTVVMGAVNTFIGAAIEPAPLMPTESASRSSFTSNAFTSIDVQKFGHLFGIEPPPPPPDAQNGGGPGGGPDGKGGPGNGPKGPVCMTCEPVKSSLRLQLLATMVANDRRWSMALISDLDAQKTAYYLNGETIKNATIHDIVRDPQMRVIIINNDTNRLEYIDGTPGNGAANTTGLAGLGTAPVPPPGGEGGNTDGISKQGDHNYTITRAKLDQTLANLNELATQARIVPNFKNGTSNGFKLFSIQPGSLYSAIGIQNGDVITQINGYDMNSPEKALEIYTRLKDASNVKVTYERNGQSMSSDYSIR